VGVAPTLTAEQENALRERVGPLVDRCCEAMRRQGDDGPIETALREMGAFGGDGNREQYWWNYRPLDIDANAAQVEQLLTADADKEDRPPTAAAPETEGAA
jgi:hypothetical protein